MLKTVNAGAVALLIQDFRHEHVYRIMPGPVDSHGELGPAQSGVGIGFIHLYDLKIAEDPAVLKVDLIVRLSQCDRLGILALADIALRDQLRYAKLGADRQRIQQDLALRVSLVDTHFPPADAAGGLELFDPEADAFHHAVVRGLDDLQPDEWPVLKADRIVALHQR